ncbi:MAG: hypothetical protein AB7S26_06390 [Sandaracinaceae bacterium]
MSRPTLRAIGLAPVLGLVVLALVAIVQLGAPSVARAGPWAPDQGAGYIKLWFKYLYGFQYNDGDGNNFSYGAYHEAHLSTYVEVGLFDRFALVLHAPLLTSYHLEDPRPGGGTTSHVTPGDPTLSMRWQLLAIDRLAASVEVGLRMPFARSGPVQDVYSTDDGYPQIGQLRIGAGVWDVPLVAAVGYGFDGWYLAASGGYVIRSSGYDHQIVWSAEGGGNFDSQWAMRGRITGVHSIDVWFDDRQPGHSSPSGIGNGTGYLGFAAELDYQFQPNWYVGATVEGGLGFLSRQTGGPVVTLYLANRFGPTP